MKMRSSRSSPPLPIVFVVAAALSTAASARDDTEQSLRRKRGSNLIRLADDAASVELKKKGAGGGAAGDDDTTRALFEDLDFFSRELNAGASMSMPPGGGTCGDGSVGDGVCADPTECCSQWGWCGTSAEHCGGFTDEPCGGGKIGSGACADRDECCGELGDCGTAVNVCGEGGVDGGIYAPSATLTWEDVKVGLDAFEAAVPDGWEYDLLPPSQEFVDVLNDKTASFGLYRQTAFLAQIIWETQGLLNTAESGAVTPPYETRDSYQACDWDTLEEATNGEYFYGRGYMQLSWCVNYKDYGNDRLVDGDPDFFYNNPDVVLESEYAMDSAVWYFQKYALNRDGEFGELTRSINGIQECDQVPVDVRAVYRFEIFEGLAERVGLEGYSEEGCYDLSATTPPPSGGTCGDGSVGDGKCSAPGACCSQYGWCGTGPDFCGGYTDEPCGGGAVNNGACSDGTSCCSQYGYCGAEVDHCGKGGPEGGIYAPSKVMTWDHVQAGLDAALNNDVLGTMKPLAQSPEFVDELNAATMTFGLYRQTAFLAQIIWQTQGLNSTEEPKAVTPPYETRESYQACDWNTLEEATNGEFFYGRGYIQLSWCANYKSYSKDRLVNDDPDFFYNDPGLVATEYAMDSAVWFFQKFAIDRDGQFGELTRAITGQEECDQEPPDAKAVARYNIFKGVAESVGLIGYSEEGCYEL